MPAPDLADQGRLRARPPTVAPSAEQAPGLQPLGLASGRDGLLHVPPALPADRPARLVVLLHGAGSQAQNVLGPLLPVADEVGVLVLAPDSRGSTWDVIRGGFGPDVRFLDSALEHVFARFPVDPAQLVVGGFSDGASYALSLGLTNGDLFSHILAFSPGFLAPAARAGAPRIFISHGVHDRVLPIDRCSRRLVPPLEQAGYDVRYVEFDGPHTVPPAIAAEALDWLGGAEAPEAP